MFLRKLLQEYYLNTAILSYENIAAILGKNWFFVFWSKISLLIIAMLSYLNMTAFLRSQIVYFRAFQNLENSFFKIYKILLQNYQIFIQSILKILSSKI